MTARIPPRVGIRTCCRLHLVLSFTLLFCFSTTILFSAPFYFSYLPPLPVFYVATLQLGVLLFFCGTLNIIDVSQA